MRHKPSVKTELFLGILGKRFNEVMCVAIQFLVFVFSLNRASFSRFGPKIGYKFSFVSSLNGVRV